jgi:hypothetical protein
MEQILAKPSFVLPGVGISLTVRDVLNRAILAPFGAILAPRRRYPGAFWCHAGATVDL